MSPASRPSTNLSTSSGRGYGLPPPPTRTIRSWTPSCPPMWRPRGTRGRPRIAPRVPESGRLQGRQARVKEPNSGASPAMAPRAALVSQHRGPQTGGGSSQGRGLHWAAQSRRGSVPQMSSMSLSPQRDLLPRTRRRLARGTLLIDARLDLHGLSLAQAEQALTVFVAQARAQRKVWLLVITGKGVRGEGKLRSALPEWLDRGSLAGQIVEYGPAAANHGGAGAFYLRARRARR